MRLLYNRARLYNWPEFSWGDVTKWRNGGEAKDRVADSGWLVKGKKGAG